MLHSFLDLLLHLDVHLAQWSAAFGLWLYLILFLIIFAETGLVITPFLPGDSLLFAAGALTALPGSGLELGPVWLLLVMAAFAGDNTNYQIGRRLGPRLFNKEKSLLLNPRYLEKTQLFYAEHGAKTVLLARFMPILRTFAPFVAGMGRMSYRKFAAYSLGGSVLWMSLFLGAGAFFGNIPSVKSNFHIVIFAVIGLSFLPMLIGFLRGRQVEH